MNFQTPLQFISTDSNGNRLFFKRDDLLPFSFGGNKVRIAQCYMQDLRNTAANHVVCYGNARSNLCRTMSNLCYAENLPCTIISPADDDGSRQITANERLCRLCGAKIVPCIKQNVAETVASVLSDIEFSGEKPYYIYGNNKGTGRKAVPVRAYQPIFKEILSQAGAQGFTPTKLVLAVGTGTTAAGLLCGLADSSRESLPTVVGVSIAREGQTVIEHIRDYVTAWAEENHRNEAFIKKAMEHLSIQDHCRETYGHCPPDAMALIEQYYRHYGIGLDTTYTGKALYGYLQTLQLQNVRNENIIFLHTGGTPLFFDSLYKNRERLPE